MTEVIIRPGTYTTSRVFAQVQAAFQFSVLTCQKPLLATKTICADGKEVPFDKPKFFYYKYCEIESLEDFEKLVLTWLATEPQRFHHSRATAPRTRSRTTALQKDC